jgi:hypothetical protein
MFTPTQNPIMLEMTNNGPILPFPLVHEILTNLPNPITHQTLRSFKNNKENNLNH